MVDVLQHLTTVLLIGLASARLSVLVVDDYILEPVRHRIFLKFPPKDVPQWGFEYQQMDANGYELPEGIIRPHSWLGELLSCNRCVSVWATAGVYVFAAAYGVVDGTVPEHLVSAVAATWLASWGAHEIV